MDVAPHQTGTVQSGDVTLFYRLFGRAGKTPVLIVRGTKSDRYGPEALRRVKEGFPHIKMVDVESGHDVAGGAPQQLIAGAKAFLAANG